MDRYANLRFFYGRKKSIGNTFGRNGPGRWSKVTGAGLVKDRAKYGGVHSRFIGTAMQ